MQTERSQHARTTAGGSTGRRPIRALLATLRATLLATLLASAQASIAGAQGAGTIAGTVRDSAGTPIRGVEVRVGGARMAARTDSAGRFRVANVPAGKREVQFRRLGFEPRSTPATVAAGATASLTVSLEPLATELDPVSVRAEQRQRELLHDFWERRSRGFGHFITRDDIEQRNPQVLSDMLRLVPGARLLPSSVGGGALLRFARATAARDCPPQYWIDGVKAHGFDLDDMPPGDVEGIEIYPGSSTVPPQFNLRDGTTICGVVVIWSRLPGH